MLKIPKKDDVVDASFGFKTTTRLEIIYPVESTYHQQRGVKYSYVDLAVYIYKRLCKKLGSYSYSWYIAYPDLMIKYFDHSDNEWKMDYLIDLLKEEETNEN